MTSRGQEAPAAPHMTPPPAPLLHTSHPTSCTPSCTCVTPPLLHPPTPPPAPPAAPYMTPALLHPPSPVAALGVGARDRPGGETGRVRQPLLPAHRQVRARSIYAHGQSTGWGGRPALLPVEDVGAFVLRSRPSLWTRAAEAGASSLNLISFLVRSTALNENVSNRRSERRGVRGGSPLARSDCAPGGHSLHQTPLI